MKFGGRLFPLIACFLENASNLKFQGAPKLFYFGFRTGFVGVSWGVWYFGRYNISAVAGCAAGTPK
jgi:hypothetical protein